MAEDSTRVLQSSLGPSHQTDELSAFGGMGFSALGLRTRRKQALSPEMHQHIIDYNPVGLQGTEPVLDVALLQHGKGAEDEAGRLHLDFHDARQAETGQTLPALAGDEAQRSSGEGQGAVLPPLLAVDVVGAGPVVDGNIPTHFG